MCPYTQDDVVALWVDKAVNAKAAASVGKAAGAYVGQKALEQIPFVGAFLGSKAGEAVGRKIAIEASGGWEYIKETSDLSFNSLEDMAVWLYATKSSNEHYPEVYKATCGIYPELQEVYYSAIMNAGK
jgi:phage tail tape-measure protein